jgi:hypothetical protein
VQRVRRDDSNAFCGPADRDLACRAFRDGNGQQGLGLDALVRFNPTVKGMRPDVALAHELEHARHRTQGIMDPGVVGARPGPGDIQADMPVIVPPQRPDEPMGANVVNSREHQAMGIGQHPMYPQRGGRLEGMTEAAYVRERNLLGDNLQMRSSYRSANPFASGAAPLPANTSMASMYAPVIAPGENRR